MIIKKEEKKSKKNFFSFNRFLKFYFFSTLIAILLLFFIISQSQTFEQKKKNFLHYISEGGRIEYIYLPIIAFKAFKSNFYKIDKLEFKVKTILSSNLMTYLKASIKGLVSKLKIVRRHFRLLV